MTGTPHRAGFHAELPNGYAFGEDSALEPVCLPPDLDHGEAEAGAQDDAVAIRQETVARFLSLLLTGAPTPELVGRRAILLACLLRHQDAPAGTCRTLGKVLGVSHARAHALLTRLRDEMAAGIGRGRSEG